MFINKALNNHLSTKARYPFQSCGAKNLDSDIKLRRVSEGPSSFFSTYAYYIDIFASCHFPSKYFYIPSANFDFVTYIKILYT